MSLKQEEIESLIKESIPDAEIIIKDLAGDNNHYSATIKSKVFNLPQTIWSNMSSLSLA